MAETSFYITRHHFVAEQSCYAYVVRRGVRRANEKSDVTNRCSSFNHVIRPTRTMFTFTHHARQRDAVTYRMIGRRALTREAAKARRNTVGENMASRTNENNAMAGGRVQRARYREKAGGENAVATMLTARATGGRELSNRRACQRNRRE